MTKPATPDTLPQDLSAERGVLGAMLLDNRVIVDVQAAIDGKDFYRLAHQTIYESIVRIDGRGEPADPVTVAADLERTGDLVRVGDRTYLVGLLGDAPIGGSATYYAAIVAEKATMRRLVQAGQRITQVGFLGGEGASVEDVLEAAQSALAGVHGDVRDEDSAELEDITEDTMAWLEDPNEEPSLPTGLPDLDAKLKITPGSVTVVGARPGIGKSVLGLQIASHVASLGYPALVWSLEMSKRELNLRMLAADARVDLGHLMAKKLDDAERMRLARAQAAHKGRPLTVSDNVTGGLSRVRRLVADAARRGSPYRLVVVDYLQLMESVDTKGAPRQQVVAEMSRGLKLLAKQFGVPIILASQVNRSFQDRADKRPALSDLRESGAIEQDADNVILLHRDDEVSPGEIELIIAKQRQGPTGPITFAFQGHYQRIVGLSSQA